jgi:hypothetical protein
LSTEEINLIEKLEQFITWAGKYPGPLKYEDLIPRIIQHGISPLYLISSSDFQKYISIYERLSDKLKNKL